MHEWSSDALWNKAKVYIDRAFTGDRDSELFPFFAAIALEFLARAALARVHPSLLADPQDANNILYAFGFPTTERPVSVPAKTIFSRLSYVVEDFNKDDQSFCLLCSERRNQELHTGQLAFVSLRNGEWLPDYYRVINKITLSLGRTLDELLGTDEAREAQENIEIVRKETITAVKQLIADTKRKMAGLTSAELDARRGAHNFELLSAHYTAGGAHFQRVCPACQSHGAVFATRIGSTAARIKEGSLASQRFFAPKKFECNVCGLEIVGSQALRVAELSDQIVDEDISDPVEFFRIDPMDYVDQDELRRSLRDEDYGNE
jgi:hypothetical protein